MKCQRYLQAHCQSPTSQRTDQSFVKELAKPTQEKLFLENFPTLQKKIKNATHSRHSMTHKPNNANGLQGRATEHQPVTAVWRNGGFSGKLKVSFSSQLLWWVDSLVLRNPPLRQAAERYASCYDETTDYYKTIIYGK